MYVTPSPESRGVCSWLVKYTDVTDAQTQLLKTGYVDEYLIKLQVKSNLSVAVVIATA